MSAYVVSKSHVDAILRAALHGPSDRGPKYAGDGWHGVSWFVSDPREIAWDSNNPAAYFGAMDGIRRELRRENANETGAMLVAVCVASVWHRYPNDPLDELPGTTDAYWVGVRLNGFDYDGRGRTPSAVEALKLVACFEYQSCELPTWPGSEAQRFCEALRHALIGALPGYDAAAWEWDEERVAA